MKLHRKLFATGVVATSLLTFTACNDFLELEPPSNVTPESYFQNDEQLGAYAIGRYNDIFTTPSGWGQGSIINGDAGTDNMAATDPNTSRFTKDLWMVGHSGDLGMGLIRTCNYFFQQVLPRYESGFYASYPNANHYIGEMYFIRAWVYYSRLKTYGDYPIVSEVVTDNKEDLMAHGKRMPRNEVADFILSDLDIAESCFENFTPSSKNFPSLPVVYGLKAKVYLWNEQYAEAADYARRAIDACGGQPMTEAEWLDPTTGFNTATSGWMWYLHPSPDNMGNLANFTGHIASEAGWGYSDLYEPMILSSLYDEIAYTDFRKQAFLDPDRSLFNYQSVRGQDWLDGKPDYLSLKFRCASGNTSDFTTGASVDIPIMRVEEMYFIEAEAIGASQGVAAGVAKLNSFMQGYRQPDYNFQTSDLRTFQLEVLKQMRIEFWGEGNAFPTAKRLKPDVIQNYEGTNVPIDQYKINTKGGKPNWTLVIPQTEVDANVALQGNNNPDPTAAIPVRPTPIGEFAAGNN